MWDTYNTPTLNSCSRSVVDKHSDGLVYIALLNADGGRKASPTVTHVPYADVSAEPGSAL